MNTKCIQLIKKNWPGIMQRKGGCFAFSLNGYDARKSPHARPILLVDASPVTKTAITTQDPTARVEKVAFGVLQFNKAGNLAFHIDPKSTLTSTAMIRAGLKHFASLARADGALKELASLQNITKLSRAKVDTASGKIRLDVPSDDQLAQDGGKKSYIKNKQKQQLEDEGSDNSGGIIGIKNPLARGPRSDDEVAAESTFKALLVGLKKWNDTFHGTLTRENVAYAKSELVEIGKVARKWKDSHKKKATSKRGKAVESVIQKLAELNQQVKEHEARWWSEDETNEMLDLADQIIDSELKDAPYKGNLGFLLADADKALRYLKQRSTDRKLEADDRDALKQKHDELRRARTRAVEEKQKENDLQSQKLEKAWDQIGKRDLPEVTRQVERLTGALMEDLSTHTQDVVDWMNDDAPMGPTSIDRVKTSALKIIREATELAVRVRRSERGSIALDSKIKKTMEAIDKMLKAMRKRGAFDDQDFAPILTELTSAAVKLTELQLQQSQKKGGDWTGSLGREDTATSAMRTSLIRFSGEGFVNELMSEAAQLIEQNKGKSLKEPEFGPSDWATHISALKERCATALKPLGISDGQIDEGVTDVWPNTSIKRKFDDMSVPSVGLVATAALIRHPELVDTYTRQVESLLGVKFGFSVGIHDIPGFIRRRVQQKQPVGPNDVVRDLPQKVRGKDELLDTRLSDVGLLTDEDKDLGARGSEALAVFVGIRDKNHRENTEMYEVITEVFKSFADPLLKPDTISAIPKNIRAICLKSVLDLDRLGATERQTCWCCAGSPRCAPTTAASTAPTSSPSASLSASGSARSSSTPLTAPPPTSCTWRPCRP